MYQLPSVSTGFSLSTSRLRRPVGAAADVVGLDVALVAVITVVVCLPVACVTAVEATVGFADVPVAIVAKGVNKSRITF